MARTKWPAPQVARPTDEELEELMLASLTDEPVPCTGSCQCDLYEPDGVCPQGYPSWLLYLGMA